MGTTLVTIYGRSFRLRSDDDSDVAALARMVESKMRELEAIDSKRPTQDLAILTALQLADELARIQHGESLFPESAVPSEVHARIEDLLGLLEGVPDIPDES